MNAISRLQQEMQLCEPDYINQPPTFWESHDSRMIRKFGSKEAFDRVKTQHRLVPRAREAGLTESMGFTDENLSNRKQSSTLNAHRLVQYVTRVHSPEKAEELYNVLNRKHFVEGGILNDQSLLLSSVDEVGLNRQQCQEFLDSEEGIKEILRTVDLVHSLGIHSIPVLIINGGQVIVQGAAGADEVMEKLREVINNPQNPGSLLFPRS